MKLMIEIPKKVYNKAITRGHYTIDIADYLKNGTPLPKGHGDLIDRNKLFDELNKNDVPYNVASYIIEKADVVIEADEESEGKE